jgi:hypothetical protein
MKKKEPSNDYWKMCAIDLANGTSPSDEKPCKCNVDLVVDENYEICPKCGTIHNDSVIQDYGIVTKRKFYYNKINYFQKYLYCLQGMSSFDPIRHGIDIQRYFKIPNKSITKKEIRQTLNYHNVSQKYLRYLPEIYYYITGCKPIILRVSDVNDMVTKYRMVIEYERKTNVRMASSKRYFAKRFLSELPKPYSNLRFFIEPFKHVDLEIYDRCYDELF